MTCVEIRTQSIGLVQASFLASGALSVQFFPQMRDYMSLHGIFFLYGASGHNRFCYYTTIVILAIKLISVVYARST